VPCLKNCARLSKFQCHCKVPADLSTCNSSLIVHTRHRILQRNSVKIFLSPQSLTSVPILTNQSHQPPYIIEPYRFKLQTPTSTTINLENYSAQQAIAVSHSNRQYLPITSLQHGRPQSRRYAPAATPPPGKHLHSLTTAPALAMDPALVKYNSTLPPPFPSLSHRLLPPSPPTYPHHHNHSTLLASTPGHQLQPRYDCDRIAGLNIY